MRKMWKINFFSIIEQVDCVSTQSQSEFEAFRAELIFKIQSLKLALSDINNIQEIHNTSHLISFALVAYCDERLSLYALRNNLNYDVIQLSLFNVISAGEIFYEYLDTLVSERKSDMLTYWAYYFLLKHGYQGKYADGSDFKRTVYLRQLKAFIHNPKHEVKLNLPHKGHKVKAKLPLHMLWSIPLALTGLTYLFISFY